MFIHTAVLPIALHISFLYYYFRIPAPCLKTIRNIHTASGSGLDKRFNTFHMNRAYILGRFSF